MGLLSKVRILIKTYGIFPSQKFGQNFLVEGSALEFIKNSIAPQKDKTYIEVGPGFLFLTEEVAKQAGKIVAIEKDRRFEKFYRENAPKNVEIILGDALKENFSRFGASELYGNIPYNISTDLLVKMSGEPGINRAVLLLQKEFAMRLLAPPGNKTYGAITVFIDFFFEKKFLKTFPPHFFYPRPSVSSTLIELRKKENPGGVDAEFLFKVVRSAFSGRRKKISNSLSGVFGKEKTLYALGKAGIPESTRPEQLSSSDFIKLSEFLKNT